MSFKKMEANKYPIRLWGLVGYPGAGKSTFAARMHGPFLAIDADHRFSEVRHLAGDVYQISDRPEDNNDPDRIARLLDDNMPNSGVKTIVVDSLTALIAPFVTAAIQDKEHGREKNLYAAFKDKALAMRQLQDAVTKWGCDVLWIYHLNDARDGNGKEVTKATVSATELVRLTRSVNLQLQLMRDGDKRGVKVIWARRGRFGMTLWDEAGEWKGMPERIESAVYDGLTPADQERIANTVPNVFPNEETALAWGVERGAFKSVQHARNAWAKLLREHAPKDDAERAALWTANVTARLATHETNGEHEDDQIGAPPDGQPQPEQAPQVPPTGNGPTEYHVGPTEFWKEVARKRFPRENANQIIAAYTTAGKTDWAYALAELQSK
ncbi:MAG: AAA family ATPase [Anaerolineae bacterium]